MREFDSDTLAQFNGQDGSPVYIAYQGKGLQCKQEQIVGRRPAHETPPCVP